MCWSACHEWVDVVRPPGMFSFHRCHANARPPTLLYSPPHQPIITRNIALLTPAECDLMDLLWWQVRLSLLQKHGHVGTFWIYRHPEHGIF